MTMAAWETSIDQQSAVDWLHMGPANALLEGQPEDVHAEAAKRLGPGYKQRATDEGLAVRMRRGTSSQPSVRELPRPSAGP